VTTSDYLAIDSQDDGIVTQVIRPAAVIPEEAAHAVLMQLSLGDVRVGGKWEAEPSTWRRYDRPWDLPDSPGSAVLLGSIHIAYGVPTRYEITVFRVSVTADGTAGGWTVSTLCDEALAYGGLSLATCPRADLRPPPQPFRFQG